MFNVNGLNKYIGGRHLLHNVGFKLGPGECVALAGANGTGKSTLLKVLAGQESYDGGEIALPRDTTVGYLPQHAELDSTTSLREELRGVFAEILSHEAELETLSHKLGEVDPTTDEYMKIADRWGHLHHEIERAGVYEMDANIGRIVAGLGFKNADLDRPCADFSGGWRMRILLAKLLLRNPDVMLLDEPTNHLDLETMIWLEDWIRSSDTSVIMVSHERAFMDNLAARIFEIHAGQVTIYKGNYSDYLEQRKERWEMWGRAYTNQTEEIAKTQAFIDRFRYQASKASLVQSRIKQLEKVERIGPPPSEPSSIHFRFPEPDRGSKEVYVAEKLGMAFGPLQVFEDFDFGVYRGERIALVGLNGAGKSTLMKLMAGKYKPTSGELRQGPSTTIGYFAQYESEGLSVNNSVFQEVNSVAPSGGEQQVRNVLGGFFFAGDDCDKKIGVLSGGERTRVRLAKMLFSGANTLLLDEPTNHLDLASRRTLEDAMKAYPGTLIFVSHDRVFLEQVPNRILEIKEGGLRSFSGNYTDYCRALATLGETSPLVAGGGTKSPGGSSGVERMTAAPKAEEEESGGLSREERKALARDMKKVEKECEAVEQAIDKAEKRVRAIDEEMMMPSVYSNPAKCSQLGTEQKTIRTELEQLNKKWEKLQKQLTGAA